MAYEFLFTLVALVGTSLLLYHAYKNESLDFLLLFFGAGFLFGIIRENLLQMLILAGILPSLYSYSAEFIRILYAPIVVGLGWVFAFYNGLFTSKQLYQKENPWVTSTIAALFVMLIAFPIEVTAVEAGWWTWSIEGIPLILGIPPLVPFGWATAAFLFNSSFILIKEKINGLKNQYIVFLLLTLPLIGLHFLIVLLLRVTFISLAQLV
ncbi:MAG: carotenoid biosynthesis protein [Candidatus Heimdallarchaeota archaeon]|nr:carotenoid biosynthesis protein [Candidatus Heimdallarchaeota archaeon]